MIRIRLALIAAVTAITLLAGCASPTMKRFEQDQLDARDRSAAQVASMGSVNEGHFRRVDEMWLGDQFVVRDSGEKARETTALDVVVSYREQYPVTLQMVAEWIGTNTGVPVTVTSDAVQAAAETVYDPLGGLIDRSATGLSAGTQNAPRASSNGAGAFVIQYRSGTLRGLLDEVTARTGNSWTWRNGRVVILNVDTETFAIHAVSGVSSFDATVSNQAKSGGASGGGGGEGSTTSTTQEVSSGQTTTMKTEIDVFTSIGKTAEAMISPKGKVWVSGATSSLTVTDVPAVLDRIRSYVSNLNKQITRQVVVDMRVYTVDLKSTESYGIDWNVVYESMSGKYRAVSSFGNGPIAQDAGSLSLSVIDNTNVFGGSNALLKALSQQGNVTVETSAAVATLSNKPAPVQVVEDLVYIEGSDVSQVANVGVITTRRSASKVTGFSMMLLPVVLDNNDVLLQVQMSLSSLRELRQLGTAANPTEAPLIDARQYMQSVKMASGSTLVLSGFEQDRISSDATGIGAPRFTLFGGSRNAERKRTILVVTLTPKVVE